MKVIVTRIACLFSVLFLAALPAHAIIDATLQMQLGNPSGATSDTNNHAHFLVVRSVEALDYSDTLGEPLWASWDLTASDVGSISRSTSFFTDTNLPPNFYRVTDNDYNGVGPIFFTRGHMCPSEDRTDTRADNNAVFFMSNIVPQDGTNNSGVWGTFEGYCRSLTTSDELLITCGPSGFSTNTIPSGKAYIPAYVWKIVVVVPLGSGTATNRINTGTQVIAIKIPNSAAATNSWQSYQTSVGQIEADTGLTFFTALPPDVAAALRGQVDTSPGITSFSPASGAGGDSVILTGTNLTSATAVAFDGIAAAFIVNSDSQITTIVPTNGFSGTITVTTPRGTATSATSFTVTGSSGGGGGTPSYTGVLAGWDASTLTAYGPSPFAPTTNVTGITILSGLTRGSAVTTGSGAAARAWGGVGWTSTTEAAAITAGQYVTFAFIPNNGTTVSFTSISQFDYRRSSGAGPPSGELQYQAGTGSSFLDITNLAYSVSTSSGGSIGAINLTGIPALQNVAAGVNVTFRIVNFGGGSGGTWYIYDKAGSPAPDLAVSGSITPVTTLTPIEAWRLTYFGITNNAGGAADTFAVTSDGMPNLLKYALGLNPTMAVTNPVVGDISTGFLRITAPHNTNATDVTLSAVVSGDLINWTTAGTVIDQNGTVFQAHDSTPVTGGTNRFIQLRVTDP